MYSHNMVRDASNFIGMELFSMLHSSEYSINFIPQPQEQIEPFKTKLSLILKAPGAKIHAKLVKPQNLKSASKDQEEIEERPDLGRMSAEMLFGGSVENDAKVFDLPVNDELYISKYKHIVVNDSEKFHDREQLFSFFRYYTISDSERKELWKIRIGNSLGITRELYESLCIRLQIEGIIKQHQKLINDDLFRTLPNYSTTKVGDTMYRRLTHLLSLFQMYRPDIGYVQGMSFLVSMLYYYYDDFDTFVLFSNLILTKPLVRTCYDFDISKVGALQARSRCTRTCLLRSSAERCRR
jgi:Rab-GTPase-TBC domain